MKKTGIERLGLVFRTKACDPATTPAVRGVIGKLVGYALGMDGRETPPGLIIMMLSGETRQEVAAALKLGVDQVENKLRGLDVDFSRDFHQALVHIQFDEIEEASRAADRLGYTDYRFLPAEYVQVFQPKRWGFDVGDCTAEARFLSERLIFTQNLRADIDNRKVQHLLSFLCSTDPEDVVKRQEISSWLLNLAGHRG